ncbi:uncharacterized protein LOC108109570 [Drosophila eugracilis]|uniref:uncharacterized protein LOC108109570 n=1 Tax=Drosophila eugracilis TaxID=29029 RepID=UPI0007E64F1A|nr:uncharacterized protein LOC108109570 [Drosophila eugracilis]
MSGSRRCRTFYEYCDYFMPGIYDYPVTHSAETTISAYLLDPILASVSSPWSVPISHATYVAGPLGVINYLSDMQSHLALPTIQNLETGLIYTTMSSISPMSDIQQTLQSCVQMEQDVSEDEGYGYEIPELDFSLENSISESDGDGQQQERSPMNSSTVEISEETGSGESAKSEEVPRKRKKLSSKRVYKAAMGYLVEEPTSELSEDDPEELPPTSGK